MNSTAPQLPLWAGTFGWLAGETALVVLAAAAAQPFLRAAVARRSLWRAVLGVLGLLLVAEFTGVTGQTAERARNIWLSLRAKPLPPPALIVPAPDEAPLIPKLSTTPSLPISDAEFAHLLADAAPPAPFPLHSQHSITPPLQPSPNWWPAQLWLLGLGALLARLAWTQLGFALLRLRHFARAAAALETRVSELAAGLGLRRRVRVLESLRLRAPAAFGWLRPTVGLPGDFTARFTAPQRDVMLAHELAHLAARDPLWQLLADLVAAALWWHPLAWVARRQHRAATEQAADEASLVIADGPVTLAECLLALGREATADQLGALGMAGLRSGLGRRVERLLALPRGDWHAPNRARLTLQTTVALACLAAIALLPGCAANRSAGEAPSQAVAHWWQAKTKTPENQPRGTTLLIKPQPKPVIVAGRVTFNGTPPAERDIPLPPNVQAARTNAPLKTRFHRVSPDGGLADVLVYVKSGLTNQTFTAPTNAFVVRAESYQFEPYIGAIQAGQTVRWESVATGVLNLNPTPTNRANRAFSYVLMPERTVTASFAAPELLMGVKADVFPWMFHYLSVFEHPYFAVTAVDGRFRFPQPLPPGRYTLAAVHRQAGESVQELDLTQPLPAGQPSEIQFVLSNKVLAPFVIAVGDEVSVSVYRRDDLRTQTKVQPNGRIILPLVGTVEVAGKTILNARNAIRDAYQPAHMDTADVTLTLVRPSPQTQNPSQRLVTSSPTNALDISVGRQLFVDDFLIESNSLKRVWHQPVLAAELPSVLVPAQAPLNGARPFCDQVWYDTTNQLFKMRWAFEDDTAVFRSTNGIAWPRTDFASNPERTKRARPVLIQTEYESVHVTVIKNAQVKQLRFGFGRDGLQFRFGKQSPVITPPTPADGSQWTDLHPLHGGLLVVGRNLHCYFGGRVQRPGEAHASAAVGLATLRRDGFASLDAGPEGGVLTTKPVTFTGKFMFVNMKTNAPDGEMLIEILDADGNAIERFSRVKCIPLAADQTLMGVNWQNGAQSLAELVGKPVRFRFHLKNASLYSFWVGSGSLGRSLGRVAGGGPHFTNDVDTIGNLSYRSFPVTRTNAPSAVPPPKPGALVVGDELKVEVLFQQNLTNQQTLRTQGRIQPNGKISVPIELKSNVNFSETIYSGQVDVAGKTMEEARQSIRADCVAAGLENPVVTVTKIESQPVAPKAPAPIQPTNSPKADAAPSPFAERGEKVAEGRLRGAATNAVAANTSPLPPPLAAQRAREPEGAGAPVAADTANLKALAGRLVQAQVESTKLRFDKGPLNPAVKNNERLIAALEKAIGEKKAFLEFLGAVRPQNLDVETALALATLTRRHQMLLDAKIELAEMAGDRGPLHPDTVRTTKVVTELAQQIEAAKQKLTPTNVDPKTLDTIRRRLGSVQRQLLHVENIEHKLQNPAYTTSERLAFYSSVGYDVDDARQKPQGRSDVDYASELERNKLLMERTIKGQSALYRPSHPKMQTLYKQYETLEKNLQEELNKAAAKFEAHKRWLQQEEQKLRERLEPPTPKTPTESAPGENAPLLKPTNPPKPVGAATALPVPNPYAKTNSQVPFLTHSSKGAQRINRKLEEIVLPEVHFDAVPLVGVVQRLIEDAKKFDPEKQGLNFLINDVAPAAPLLDTAGNPVPVARPVALSEGLVRVSQPLRNLTLRQALDVICKNAELPTQFSVEEYAIAFIPRGPVAYYARMFRVNPDTFIQGLQGVVGNPVVGVTSGTGNTTGATGQNQPATTTTTGLVRAVVPATGPATQRTAAEVNALVRQFFQSAGVTGLGATNSSTQVIFNPENGQLLARGTTNELRLIEQAIQKVQPGAASK